MAGSSKTSNKARSTASKNIPQGVGITTFLIATGQGSHAYVRDAKTGKNPLLKTDSDAFFFAIAENAAAGYATKLRAELEGFAVKYPTHGWDGVLARLEAAGVFDVTA